MQLSLLCITLLMTVGAAMLVQLVCSVQLWGSGWDVHGHRGTAGIGVLGGWKDTDCLLSLPLSFAPLLPKCSSSSLIFAKSWLADLSLSFCLCLCLSLYVL